MRAAEEMQRKQGETLDAALIAAEDEIARLCDKADQVEDDEKTAPLYERVDKLERLISETPAESVAGLAVKFRRAFDEHMGLAQGIDCYVHTTLRTLGEGLMRLAGPPQHRTRPVLVEIPDDVVSDKVVAFALEIAGRSGDARQR
jgi:hypothetical protein